MPRIETARTVIEDIVEEDAAFFVDLLNTPDWLRFIGDRNVANVQDARDFLNSGLLKFREENRFGYYIIRLKPSLEPIGICGFLKKPYLENPDLGFALMPSFFGQGLGFESSRAILDFGIAEFQFPLLDAVTTLNNVRSMKLLEKLGFESIGTIPSEGNDCELQLFRLQVNQE